MSTCGCRDCPSDQYTTQVIFDTLATPSIPRPPQGTIKQRLTFIRLRIHPDKHQAVAQHCGRYQINIRVANALWEWLIAKPQNEEHFQRHWDALGNLDQHKRHFPWNPEGKEIHDCLLPIDLNGRGIVPSSVTTKLKPEIIYSLTTLPSWEQKPLSEALAVLSSLQESRDLQDVILANKEQSRLRMNALERAQNAEHSNNQSNKRLKAAQEENDKLRRNKAEQEEQTNNLSRKVKSLEEEKYVYLRAFKTVQDSIQGLDHSPKTSTNPFNTILLSDDEQDGKIQVTTRAGGKRKK